MKTNAEFFVIAAAVAAAARPEPLAHSSVRIGCWSPHRWREEPCGQIGEGLQTAAGYNHSNRIDIDGHNSNNKVSVTRSTVCDDFTDRWGGALCKPEKTLSQNRQRTGSQTTCTQSSGSTAGYLDYTDAVAWLACGNNNWKKALGLYTTFPVWRKGHTADLSLVGKITDWNNKVGKPWHGQCMRSQCDCSL